MKITDVEVKVISVPLSKDLGWKMGWGKANKKDDVLVVVRTDEGVYGVGESYHAINGAKVMEAVILSSFRPMLLGEDPRNIDYLWHKLFMATIQLGSTAVAAISGVDTALWDILGKVSGQPIYRLLGGRADGGFRAYVGCMTLGIKPIESLVAEAKSYVDQGFRALKIRGGGGVDRDIEAATAVIEAFDGTVDVTMDANSAYSWPESVGLVKKLGEVGVHWLEDPFDYTTSYHHGETGALRRLGGAPICSGGNLYSRFDVRDLIEEGGVDVLTPDVVKGGGISEVMKDVTLASAYGMLVALHTVVGIGQHANLHVAAAIPRHVLSYVEWDPSSPNPLRDEIPTKPVKVEDGSLYIGDEPGLGTDINWDVLEKYPYIEGPEVDQNPRARSLK